MSRSRITCGGCKHRTTPTQLKGSKGLCRHCGFDITRAMWKRGLGDFNIRLGIGEDQVDRLFDVARREDIHPTELIKLAVVSQLFRWDTNPDKLKQDRMLHKLVVE